MSIPIHNTEFAVVARKTFLTVCFTTNKAASRRCSSVPSRLQSCATPCETVIELKSVGRLDFDVSTEASDEQMSISEYGSTTEDGDEPTFVCLDSTSKDYESPLSALAAPWVPATTPLTSQGVCWGHTPLRAQAAKWEPSLGARDDSVKWRVGVPKNKKYMSWWKESAANIVAEMGRTLEDLDHVSHVECCSEHAGWKVAVHCEASAMCHFELIQTAAKQSLVNAAAACECISVLGNHFMPFQPTPMGFLASLGSMGNPKKGMLGFV